LPAISPSSCTFDERQPFILWQQLIPVIQQYQSFVITSHVNPDCDALGSELALAEHLLNLGKRVSIINSDACPPGYRFLDPHRRLKRYSPKRHSSLINQAEVIFVVDASGNWERVGPVGEALRQSQAIKICIDHHPDSTDFVDIAVVNTAAAATAELIFDLIRTMGGLITLPMAEALYAAIITDTGSFRFPKTNPFTHQVTAALLEVGVDPMAVYNRIYEQNPLGVIQLKGWLMANIRTAKNGQVAYYSLAQDMLKKYGVNSSDLDGFASLGQQIGGVRVTVFCMEANRGRIKISLRSDGSVAINQIVQAYGGGGHPSAAGAMVEGELDTILTEIVAQISQLAALTGAQ
jgi:phosphoesterase RecJ-like protein